MNRVVPPKSVEKSAIPAETPLEAAISVRFWGVRGSVPVCGDDKLRYGGHTPCIELRAGGEHFIVDAGTGIVPLGHKLKAEGVKKITLLLSHLHHDHVMGLFFFKPLYVPGVEVTIYCGNLDGETAEEPLRRLFSPPLFPITFDDLPASVRFVGFKAGETLEFGQGLRVKTHLLQHPSGSTAYRFEAGGHAVAVVTDMEHKSSGPCGNLCGFLKGCEAVIYDSMLCPSEYPDCKGWGHSTPCQGAALCVEAGVTQMIGFHHHPAYDDDRLDKLEAYLGTLMPGACLAKEGQELRF